MHKTGPSGTPKAGPTGIRGLLERALGPIAGRFRQPAPQPAAVAAAAPAFPPAVVRKKVALALQGGGVHGAFTWGVLDRLLEHGALDIEAISGTSAGALNAAALASGFAEGGRTRARERLLELWEGIAAIGNLSPFRPMQHESLGAAWNSDWTAGTLALEFLTRMLSPYQLNPFAINPLRQLVERVVDFERLKSSPIKLFVAATNVHTGRPRLFTTPEMSADVILASACLPSLNQAVEIDGEHYWDGGFTANPALLPLVSSCESEDIIVVQITPAHEPDLPMTARDIQGRISRIVFNAPLHRDLETIAWMRCAADMDGSGGGPLALRLRRLRLHHIDGGEALRPLGTASAFHADWSLISHLQSQGDTRAAAWISQHGAPIAPESGAALYQS
jgi:NTE family protein